MAGELRDAIASYDDAYRRCGWRPDRVVFRFTSTVQAAYPIRGLSSKLILLGIEGSGILNIPLLDYWWYQKL